MPVRAILEPLTGIRRDPWRPYGPSPGNKTGRRQLGTRSAVLRPPGRRRRHRPSRSSLSAFRMISPTSVNVWPRCAEGAPFPGRSPRKRVASSAASSTSTAAPDNRTRCSRFPFIREAGMVHTSPSISLHVAPRTSAVRAAVRTRNRNASFADAWKRLAPTCASTSATLEWGTDLRRSAGRRDRCSGRARADRGDGGGARGVAVGGRDRVDPCRRDHRAVGTSANSPSSMTTKVAAAVATTLPSAARVAVPSISTTFRLRPVGRPDSNRVSPGAAGSL